MQTVFRVQPSSRISNKDEFDKTTPPAQRSRRAHRKSRYGCHNCKRRRVKCDEVFDGGCGNCQRHGIDCDYLNTIAHTEASRINADTVSVAAKDMVQNSSIVLIRKHTLPAQLCRPPDYASPLDSQYLQLNDKAPVLQTLSFFDTFTCSTVTSIDGVAVFKDSILALAHHRDYLLHAILGMAAAHLRVMNSVIKNQQQCQRYSKTESYHWHYALTKYREELAKEATAEHIDALITTCMLVGLHTFQIAGPEDTSFVDAPRSQRQAKLRWLVVPMGFPAVLRHVSRHIASSAWVKIFNSAVPTENGGTIELTTSTGVIAELLDVCSVDFNINDNRNPYKRALMDLFALFQIETLTMRDMAQVVAYMSRLNGDFHTLLVELDSRALLILLYWLAILEKLGLWWAKNRAAQEARAIIQHLEPNEDRKMQNLLKIPSMTFAHALGNR